MNKIKITGVKVNVDDIPYGGVFEFYGKVYMKINDARSNAVKFNAVNLSNGRSTSITDDCRECMPYKNCTIDVCEGQDEEDSNFVL